MKSKLALLMFAAVGSAALAASAQTPSSSSSDERPRLFRTPTIATTRAASSPGQNEQVGVTVDESSSGVTVRTSATPRAQSYSTSTFFPDQRWIAHMNLSGEESSIAHEADQLARQLGEAKSDSDRDKLKVKLGEVLEKQFEQRQKRHEGEIAELEAQVKKLKDLVARRQENRREIVARRLEQVLRESQGLGW